MDGNTTQFLVRFFTNPATAWVVIPVVAIIIGGITSTLKQFHRHQERMAMIQRGMRPDEDALSDAEE